VGAKSPRRWAVSAEDACEPDDDDLRLFRGIQRALLPSTILWALIIWGIVKLVSLI
jgi:hypothetical protein